MYVLDTMDSPRSTEELDESGSRNVVSHNCTACRLDDLPELNSPSLSERAQRVRDNPYRFALFLQFAGLPE